MKRRAFIAGVGGVMASRSVGLAQQRRSQYRIGHLAIAAPTDNPPPPPANWSGFVQGLSEAGYTEGQNISFEHRSAHDQPDRFPQLAPELADLKVNAIFARGTWALKAAKNATRTIPIIGIDLEADPVEAGLVASISRPGGNITGLFLDLSELSGKHLQILKEIIPGASRVAVLGDPVINAPQFREMERVARALATQTKLETVNGFADLGHAFELAQAWQAAAVVVLSNPLTLAYRSQIADLAKNARLPTMFLYQAHVHVGGLISYRPDLPDMFRRCGLYMGRILDGTKPADLPIERPARFELVINLKTANTLGVTIPPTLLARADEVIE
jgi:putative ABC transport system substrate-binding protein